MPTILEELTNYRNILTESYVEKYTEVRCPYDGGFIGEDGHCEECGEAYGRVCAKCKGINVCSCKDLKEYYTPQEQEYSQDLMYGKKQAIDGLFACSERIPDGETISYKAFEEFLIKHRKQTSGRLANKVFQFSNGWNLILRKVQEMCPKNKITKEELESILVFIGQKELNWN